MASYEMTGTLKVKGETQSFPSGFSKRPFVITTQEQYPQDVQFELTKERTAVLDKFNENDSLKVTFDVRGREYNDKYFVNLNAFRVDLVASDGSAPAPQAAPRAVSSQPAAASTSPDFGMEPIAGGDADDLPF